MMTSLLLSPPSCSCISDVASSKPLPLMSYVTSSMSLPQKSSPALLGTMKTFIFWNHPFFFALPFFLLVLIIDTLDDLNEHML